MRKLSILMAFILLPLALLAQVESPKATIFGGYSYLRNNSNGFNGWTGQGTYNFTRNFGLTADFAGNYRTLDSATILGFGASTNQHMYTYMFGPTATAYFGKSSIFAHALFGQAHSSLGAGVSIPIIGGISTGVRSANAFAMAFGGGVDIGVSKHFAIRAAQVDYLQTRFSPTDALTTGLSSSVNDRQNSLRYQAGIVFRF
jgi:cytochrome oxidase assembly protein ShyY1